MEEQNTIPKEKRCYLLIIPFSTLEECETKIPDVKFFARNVLEVDDDYYDKVLLDYKKWKQEARHSSQA
jgi:hypothetical protein